MTLIPVATGRLLAALARVDTELPISTVASVAGVGRTRASDSFPSCLAWAWSTAGRSVAPVVRLARDNAAGSLIDRPGHLQAVVIDQLRLMAAEVDPAPLALVVFGSFARGEANAGSAVDACDALGGALSVALSGALLGQRAGGEHTEAVDLLNGAGDDGRQAARQLSPLLRYKTPAQYDPAPMPESDATKAVALARQLADRAAQVNARRRPSG